MVVNDIGEPAPSDGRVDEGELWVVKLVGKRAAEGVRENVTKNLI